MGGLGPTAGTLRSRVEPGVFGSSAPHVTQGFPQQARRAAAPTIRAIAKTKYSAQEAERISRTRSHADLEMEVRPRGVAGTAHARDRFAAQHVVSLLDEVLRVVRVNRHQAARVANEHQVAVAALLAGKQDLAFRRGEDRSSLRAGEIESVVMLAVARPESGDDHASHGPGERLTARGRIRRTRAGARDLGGRGPLRRTRLHARPWSIGRRNRQLAIRAVDDEPRAVFEQRRTGESVRAL